MVTYCPHRLPWVEIETLSTSLHQCARRVCMMSVHVTFLKHLSINIIISFHYFQMKGCWFLLRSVIITLWSKNTFPCHRYSLSSYLLSPPSILTPPPPSLRRFIITLSPTPHYWPIWSELVTVLPQLPSPHSFHTPVSWFKSLHINREKGGGGWWGGGVAERDGVQR